MFLSHRFINFLIVNTVCLFGAFQAAFTPAEQTTPRTTHRGGESHSLRPTLLVAGDTGLYQRTLCESQLLIINGNLYGPFAPTGVEVIPGGAFNGMDSVFRVELTFLEPVEVDYLATLCEGDTVFINNNPYHAGHYDDTEVFENAAANGCDSIVHVLLDFTAQPFSYLYDTICYDTFLLINGNRYDRDNPNGLETLRNASSTGCDSLVYIALNFRRAYVYLGEDRSVIEGDTVCINLRGSTPPQAVVWTPEPPFCFDSLCTIFCTDTLSAATSYAVMFTDTNGCRATDDIHIRVTRQHAVYGPNVFSPTGNKPNDRFFLQSDPGVAKVRRLIVHDRWGEAVYDARDLPNDFSAYYLGWDGTLNGRLLDAGVFVWWAELETYKGAVFTRSGSTTLVR